MIEVKPKECPVPVSYLWGPINSNNFKKLLTSVFILLKVMIFIRTVKRIYSTWFSTFLIEMEPSIMLFINKKISWKKILYSSMNLINIGECRLGWATLFLYSASFVYIQIFPMFISHLNAWTVRNNFSIELWFLALLKKDIVRTKKK